MSKMVKPELSPLLKAKLKNLKCKNQEEMMELLNKEDILEMYICLTRNYRLLKETNKYNSEVATHAHLALQQIYRDANRTPELWEDEQDQIIDVRYSVREALKSANSTRNRQRAVIEARQKVQENG